MYEGDEPSTDGISMIWPEAVSDSGQPLPEGEIPATGLAYMFIVNADRRALHKARIAKGVCGFFMEGVKRVAACQVIEVLDLANQRLDNAGSS